MNLQKRRYTNASAGTWFIDGDSLCTAAQDQFNPVIVSDNERGAIVAWVDSRTESVGDIYANRILECGLLAGWTTNGVAICTVTGQQGTGGSGFGDLAICSDGANGAIIVWADYRSGDFDIYAQHVNSSGSVQWTTHGIAVCSKSDQQYDPQVVSDGSGGAIITWYDHKNDATAGNISGQHLNASGVKQWDVLGIVISALDGEEYHAKVVSDGSGGAVAVWTRNYAANDTDILARRIHGDASLDSLLPVSTLTGNQAHPCIAFDADGDDGVIMAWDDSRNSGTTLSDVYAQRRKLNGQLHNSWVVNGNAVCTVSGNQTLPVAATSAAGGAILAWDDERDVGSLGKSIYAQRMLFGGTTSWSSAGVPICTAGNDQIQAAIASSGNGGVIITWKDLRNNSNYDIYAQHVRSDGVIGGGWAPKGDSVCFRPGDQDEPMLVSDGLGGCIVVWQDRRNGSDYNVYAQRVTLFGEAPPSNTQPAINDLDVEVKCDSIIVRWFAVGDGGSAGTARYYDLRVSNATITLGNFASCASLSVGLPHVVGTYERFAHYVGPCSGTKYYAIKSANWNCDSSAISNVVSGGTPCIQGCRDWDGFGAARRSTLLAPLPNPAGTAIRIAYVVGDDQEHQMCEMAIHDVAGRRVRELVRTAKSPGEYHVMWDLSTSNGVRAKAGLYYLHVVIGGQRCVRSLVVLPDQ